MYVYKLHENNLSYLPALRVPLNRQLNNRSTAAAQRTCGSINHRRGSPSEHFASFFFVPKKKKDKAISVACASFGVTSGFGTPWAGRACSAYTLVTLLRDVIHPRDYNSRLRSATCARGGDTAG